MYWIGEMKESPVTKRQVIHVCLKMQRKSNCMLSADVAQKLTSSMAANQVIFKEIPINHRKCITHFYSKLVVVDFDILCSTPIYYLFNSKHYQLPFTTIPIFHCYLLMHVSVAQCVLSIYEMIESDLSVVGKSVLKMPLDCEM